jgi:hypothetical protein
MFPLARQFKNRREKRFPITIGGIFWLDDDENRGGFFCHLAEMIAPTK